MEKPEIKEIIILVKLMKKTLRSNGLGPIKWRSIAKAILDAGYKRSSK